MAGRSVTLLALLLLPFLPLPHLAQTLPFELIGLNEGLPQSQVNTVVQDAQGYIWVGTWGGVARYDGERFRTFTTDSGLPSSRIQELLASRSGDLWILTADGPALWSGTRLIPVKDEPVSGVRGRSIAEDAAGTLWVGTNRGIAVRRGEKFQSLPLPGFPETKVYDLVPSGGDVLAVTTDGLFLCESSGRAEPVPGPPPPSSSFRTALFGQGKLWLGTEGHGLWVRDGDEWSAVALGQMSGPFIYRVCSDSAGTVYACTQEDGLYLKGPQEGAFRHLGLENGLPSSAVNCVFEDREGSLWIGTDIGGLARLGNLSVTNYGPFQGLPDPCVFGVSDAAEPGNLWVGTLHGAARLDLGPPARVAETVTHREGIANDWVWKVLQAPSGALFILTDQSLQVRPPGSRAVAPTPEGALFLKGLTLDMVMDGAGRIWLSGEDPARGGLRMTDGKGTWQSWKVVEGGRPLPACRRLSRRRAGGVWISTDDQRLGWCDGGSVIELPGLPPLPSRATLSAMLEDSRGRLWVGNDGGLAVRETDGRWGLLNDRPGFTDHHVFCLGEDRAGVVWAGTGRGVFRFFPDGTVRIMTPEDGLASYESNQGGLHCDGRGDIWISTVGGLSRYRADLQKANATAPSLVVEAAEYASRRIDFPKDLVLRWKERSVTFRIALLSYRQHARCAYRARLEGLEEEWLPLRSSSELRYTNLPAGRHALLLQAVNESGVWGKVVRVPIRVIPPFWQTWWFRLSVALLLAGSALAAHRWRVHLLKARTAELERLVAERTRDLSEEKERSETLLLNVLPKPIAERLKRDPGVIAESFPEATILFADIARFTEFSAGISPEELVSFLNEIFSAFDHLAERHGLEKIKTIGDAYMVVGGLPQPRPDSARAVAEMALDMRGAFASLTARRGVQLGLRIGINSGPVVAGVIGAKKFIYDLWGDTVNMASRMEETCATGSIQITESTRSLLKDAFRFGPRQMVEVKGKGLTAAYTLEARTWEPAVSLVGAPPPARCEVPEGRRFPL